MDLQTKKFHLVKTKAGTFRAWVHDWKMVNKLNRLLGTYGDYRATEGEEGIFNFTENDLPAVKKILRIQS